MVVIATYLHFSKLYPEVGQPFYSRKYCQSLYSQAYTKRITANLGLSVMVLSGTEVETIKTRLPYEKPKIECNFNVYIVLILNSVQAVCK